MRVKVEGCWNGGSEHGVRLTVASTGEHFTLWGGEWSRKLAGEARGFLERRLGVRRANIRFDVR